MAEYRTGNHNARHIYRGDEEIAVAFTPEDGALIVEALNEIERVHGPARSIVAPREAWGLNRLHPTCVDVSAPDEPRGTAWICISACRAPADSCTPAYGTGR